MDHIGIDVHKRESQICILGAGGDLIERRVRTTPEGFAAVLGGRPRARILLGASTESEWVARCLEGLGHEVQGQRSISRLAAADRARPCFPAPSPDDAEVLDAADPTPCRP
jgi:transposase